MKTMLKLGTLFLAGTLLLSSCQRSGSCAGSVDNPYDVNRGGLIVSSNIVKASTRVNGETWEISDAIGLYGVNGGQALSAATIYDGNANRKYTTAKSGNTVIFTSIEGVSVPTTGSIDLVAYYPYAEGTAIEYAFDTSDQSNPAAIDVLYSNNQKAITKDSNRANLVFNHALTMIEFRITSVDGLPIEATSTIALPGVLVDGTMALADGVVTTGTKSANPSVAVKNVSGNSYIAQMILPPQNLNGKEITININGKEHKGTLNLTETESGYKYIVDINYTKGSVVIVEGATINPWKEGDNNGDPIIVIGDGGAVNPNPNPNPTQPVVIYTEDFAADLGKMTPKDVAGAEGWKVNAQYKNANMTGYANGASHANEDWLVSPVFDLSAAKSMSISFEHTINKGEVTKMQQEQTLWVSNNYNGDVKAATWTQVTIPNYPTGSDWTYVESGAIELPASMLGQSNVVFAFKYLCTDASSANWQIKNLQVTSDGGKLADGTAPTPVDPTPDPKPEDPTPVNPTPTTGNLLAPGSNFDDWAAFTGALNSFGVKDYATQVDGGYTGKALRIQGTPAGNDYVFTFNVPAGAPTSANTITMYIKGTAGKSLSFNVYNTDGKTYKVFNLGTVTGSGDINLDPVASNQYVGTIDTNNEWTKVTLNIAGIDLSTTGNFFALKVGKEVAYDLLIDDITIE